MQSTPRLPASRSVLPRFAPLARVAPWASVDDLGRSTRQYRLQQFSRRHTFHIVWCSSMIQSKVKPTSRSTVSILTKLGVLWLDEDRVEFPAPSDTEKRHALIAKQDAKIWFDFYTKRESAVRIISVRRARVKEEKAYYDICTTGRDF